jgi:tryptophanyl-tRNA synthetase
MAADIHPYRATHVPVGDDQRQHHKRANVAVTEAEQIAGFWGTP